VGYWDISTNSGATISWIHRRVTAAPTDTWPYRRPWHEIAPRFGISVTRAFQIHAEAIAAAPSAAVKVHRTEIDQLTDRAIAGLLAIAEDTSVAPGTRVAAFLAINTWVARICRIHGGIEQIRIDPSGFLGRVDGE
jgi:hypothetical protein